MLFTTEHKITYNITRYVRDGLKKYIINVYSMFNLFFIDVGWI